MTTQSAMEARELRKLLLGAFGVSEGIHPVFLEGRWSVLDMDRLLAFPLPSDLATKRVAEIVANFVAHERDVLGEGNYDVAGGATYRRELQQQFPEIAVVEIYWIELGIKDAGELTGAEPNIFCRSAA